MADKTRKSPVKVPNLGANGIEYIEPQQAQTPQPQNGGLTSVIDQTTGQKIVMPASNIPQGQQQPNLFAQQKSAGYSSSAQPQQPVVEQKPAPVVQQPQVQKQQTQPVLDSNSSSAGMDYLNSLYTDPREEERLRKASVMNQRILAIGDAIRHIGNIANTVNYAPAQQLNSPVQEEYARYQQGKALRDRANQQFYTYQQQKAAQDAAQKKWEQQFNYNLAKDERTFKYNAARDAANLAEKQRQADQNYKLNVRKADDAKERAEADRKLRDTISRRSNSLGWANHNLSKQKFEYQKKNGGGRKLPEILRGKKGFYSKKMTSNELNSFYNQTYYEMKNRGLIDEGKVLAGLPADIYGRKSLSQSAIKQAVDNALMQHPEVGDWLLDEFEFDLDERPYEEEQSIFGKINRYIDNSRKTYQQRKWDQFQDGGGQQSTGNKWDKYIQK